MSDWQTMFSGVQGITRTAKTFDHGIGLTAAFARRHRYEYDEPQYWKNLDSVFTDLPAYEVVSWAKEGLEALPVAEGWDFVILDLGDCPETFHLYRDGSQPDFAEDKFRRFCVASTSVIAARDLVQCLASPSADDGLELLSRAVSVETLVDYGVEILNSDVFSWNRNGSLDWHGNSGYLAWLAFGSLARIEPLKSQQYCQQILRGRQRLYLLSGFEEIFFYLATVTPDGLLFDV